MNYVLKLNNKEFNRFIKSSGKKQKDLAQEIGVDKSYISQIANQRGISKLCAYAVCKAISPDLEIRDLFIIEKV